MKKFLLIYTISTIFLFLIFYCDFSPIANILNNLQTEMVSSVVARLLPEGVVDGHYITINSNYRLVIEKACNGLVPYFIFLSSIIAFPSSISHKLRWGIYGYLSISIVNIFRIFLISELVLENRDSFYLAHNFLGNLMLISTGIALFILFVTNRDEHISRSSKDSKMSLALN